MQNLKKNLLIVAKMTWGIWWTLTEAHKSRKIWNFIGSLRPKCTKKHLKNYRRVMSHHTEQWCKIWRKAYLSQQKWYEEFSKFSREHSKVSKLAPWWGYLFPTCIKYYQKITEELCVITLNNDAKFEEESTFPCKNDMRNLEKSHASIRRSHYLQFDGMFKVHKKWVKKLQRSYVSWHWKVMQNLKQNPLVFANVTWGIWRIFTREMESLKIYTLMGYLCPTSIKY